MKENVRSLLEAAGDQFLSGEEMSARLGITRAAVWKQVKKLREAGFTIEAVNNLGYRLVGKPDALDLTGIRELLGNHPWRDTVQVLETVDSTNSWAKREALQGAPHGSVFISDEQTGGRGRLGRSFVSPRGRGVYLSVLLRPQCAPAEVAHVTAMAAVATCDAVEQVCGIRPGIKWTNDLILREKKLTGILTEMSAEWESGTLEYLVIGIGVNCNHRETDFPEELRQKATSLYLETGQPVDRNQMAARLMEALFRLSEDMLAKKAQWMEQYARDCITLGRPVKILRRDEVRRAMAMGIDENGALLVRYDSGEEGVVFSGEVSIRGINGYI